MLTPSATDLIACVANALEETVRPGLTEPAARSALQTSLHLLRYAALRFEHEGQILADDCRTLRALLPQVAAFFEARKIEPAAATAAAVRKSLATPFRPPDAYPTVSSLAEEARVLREHVYNSLKLLQSARRSFSDDAEYGELRIAIRKYLTWRIETDLRLVDEGFEDKGPRR